MDEVFIINFNDEVYLDTDFTNDITKMEQGLTKIDSRGGTAMRDAIRALSRTSEAESQARQESDSGGDRR